MKSFKTFLEENNSVWFHGTSLGDKGVPKGETHLKSGSDGVLWLTKDKAKAERYAKTTAERRGGEPVVFMVADKDAPQDSSKFGDKETRATAESPRIIKTIKVAENEDD